MNVLLKGYFDRNFGDDIMHCMIAEKLDGHRIFVNCPQREKVMHLEKYDNVFINEGCDNIDVCLYVIGTGFMYRGKRAKAEKLISMLFAKKSKKIKSAVINCSIEAFDGKLEKLLAKHDIKPYSMITTRDENSYKFFCENFKDKQIEFCPDMVFSAEVFKNAEKPQGERLGVALVNRLYSNENYDYFKKMALMCDEYIEKHGCPVSLFAFDSGLENDTEAVISVKNMMKHPEMVKDVIYNGDINIFANEISKCTVFVTSRFHGAVAAAACGIDVVCVSDREKLVRLSSDMGIHCENKSGLTEKSALSLVEKARKAKIDGYSEKAEGHITAAVEFVNSVRK